MIRRLAGLFLDVVLPPRCAACDCLLPGEGRIFCAYCEVSALSPAATCPRCGRSLPDDEPCCAACNERGPVDRCWWAWEHGGAVQDAVHRFKYGGRADLAAPLSSGFVPEDGAWDIVVPVPLHRSRLRTRGFNQAALLARRVARRLDLPAGCRALERTRATPPQASMPASRRVENVRGAFRVRRPEAIRGKRVLLVDDVVTTGETTRECARVLKRAGAARVGVWSVARVD